MTLPASPNAISLNQVNVELGLSGTATISMNDAAVRTLAGVGGSGTIISMSNLHGKSNIVTYNLTAIAADTANYNLRSAAIAAGWNGTTPINLTATINATRRVYSTSSSTPAIVTGSFPSGSTITLVNNGIIVGMGGSGGIGSPTGTGQVGGAGGAALAMNYPLTITNNGTIYGAGGGGGGGSALVLTSSSGPWNPGTSTLYYAGGGGGGGQGLNGGPGGAGYQNGGAGSYTGRGTGGAANYSLSTAEGADPVGGAGGGNGGLFGVGGTSSYPYSPYPITPVAGGAAGNSVIRNGNVLTWGGTNGSSATYVKGTVV